MACKCSLIEAVIGENSRKAQVLDGLDLEVPPGHLRMLLGRNGCGKSTLLRVLMGLVTPDAGTVNLARPAGFIYQTPDAQVVMPTVGADVAFGLGRYPSLSDRHVGALVSGALSAVGLDGFEGRAVALLSGGQKQRVAIAGALAERPQLLLLDEPTAHLDPGDQWQVLRCVRSLVDAGGGQLAAVWVTHRLDELPMADSVSVMEHGRIAFTGSPQEALAIIKTA